MDWPDQPWHIHVWMDHDRTFAQADPAGFIIEHFGRAAFHTGSARTAEFLE